MDSRYPIFSTVQMKYIEDNNDISSSGGVDFKKIEDALLRKAGDLWPVMQFVYEYENHFFSFILLQFLNIYIIKSHPKN